MSTEFEITPKGVGTLETKNFPDMTDPQAMNEISLPIDKMRETSDAGNSLCSSSFSVTAFERPDDQGAAYFDHQLEEFQLNFDTTDDLSLQPPPPLKTEEKTPDDNSQHVEATTHPSPNKSSPSVCLGSTGHSDGWHTRFEELKEYKETHGNCEVPQKYSPNLSLGLWVNKQRNEYSKRKKGKKSQMTEERESKLDRIGFRWAQSKGQKLWDTRFNELKEYKQKVSR